jgi:GR25 family glycosyltransferase involved in LPS biosynthesis
MQPRCYVITHPESRVINDCLVSLQTHRWSYEIFPAVIGLTLTLQDWKSIGIELSSNGKMGQRPGAQGCWMSHYQLWCRCIDSNQPIIVMEHDAVVNAPWPEDLDINSRLVKLYNKAECKDNPMFGRWSKGAHAYTVTPTQARQLIEHARDNGAQAVDKHLGTLVLDWTFYKTDLVTLNPGRGPSSTSPMRYR